MLVILTYTIKTIDNLPNSVNCINDEDIAFHNRSLPMEIGW